MGGEIPASVFIVDDDLDFADHLGEYLRAQGLAVYRFGRAEDLLSQLGDGAEGTESGFFIIDLGLPSLDGVDLITLLRTRSTGGILVISGRMGPDAFNSALTAGADMFINKPVRFDQVLHAMTSIRRRAGLTPRSAAAWQLDTANRTIVTPDGGKIALTPTDTRILECLLHNGSRTVPRAELAEACGVATSSDNRNLDAAMFRLRRKLESASKRPAPFKTIHGVGYQLSGLMARQN